MRPEVALLRRFLSAPAGAAPAREAAPSPSGVDWGYFCRLVSAHTVTPQLCRLLADSGDRLVPPAVYEVLQKNFSLNAKRNLFYASELVRLINLFEKSGIRAVAYKGPLLSLKAYGDLSAREYVDLDFLIRREDLPEVERILVDACGYRLKAKAPFVREEAYLRSYALCQDDLGRLEGQVQLDVHWQVVPAGIVPRRFNKRLWNSLQEISLGGTRIKTFSAEDTLLILCIHGAKHQWERLSWVCDVAQVLRSSFIDWDRLIREARSLGCQRILFLGIHLAKTVGDVPVPPEVFRRIEADLTVARLADWIQERIWPKTEAATIWEWAKFLCQARERVWDRIRFLFCLAVHPTEGDGESMSLPGWFLPAYYLLRPFRLAGKYGGRLSRRLLHSGAEGEI